MKYHSCILGIKAVDSNSLAARIYVLSEQRLEFVLDKANEH
jgi:hypothetical protein